MVRRGFEGQGGMRRFLLVFFLEGWNLGVNQWRAILKATSLYLPFVICKRGRRRSLQRRWN